MIELIIVIVIVGILAVVAIPRYFANIEKARKAESVSTMRAIREALVGYYAVNNGFPSPDTFPISVIIDGDTVMRLVRPISPNFTFTYDVATINAAHTSSGGECDYTMNIASGAIATACD